MDDILVSLIVIACTGVVVGLIFYLVNKKKIKTEKALSELAIQKGWKFEPFKKALSWGFSIFGPEWTLESITETSENSVEVSQNNASQLTRLKSSAVSLPGQLLLNPHNGGSKAFGDMQSAMLWKLSGMFGKSEFSDLEDLPIGSPQLREKYAIHGTPKEDYSSVISHPVESILLNWKGERPWIKIGNGGLEIEIHGRNIQKPEEIENIVNLTNSLLDSNKIFHT